MWVFLRDRRSIWRGWLVTPVAPRSVNDVSFEMRTKYVSLSAWQAQYLVRLDRDTCCSAPCKWRGHEDKGKCKNNIVSLCGLQWLCLLRVGDLKVNVSKGRMSLRIATTKTRENRQGILYVFADCGHEDKRKSKRNIVCLCGLQWLCLLGVEDKKVNVSWGRMSLRTAATKARENVKANVKAILYVFADCTGCVC